MALLVMVVGDRGQPRLQAAFPERRHQACQLGGDQHRMHRQHGWFTFWMRHHAAKLRQSRS
jgi:hypothetical protein